MITKLRDPYVLWLPEEAFQGLCSTEFVDSRKGGRFEPSAALFIPSLARLTVKSKKLRRARHATRIGETRSEYITDHKKSGNHVRVIRQNRWYDYIKMSRGERVTKTGGEKNGLKFVFVLYHKRC